MGDPEMRPEMGDLKGGVTANMDDLMPDRFKGAKVAIAGLGGLGSNIAVSLARMGVGLMLLVDFDVVEQGNLNRQWYGVRHLGRLKTEALREQLEEINPFIEVKVRAVRVEENNVVELFEGYEVLCEAFDDQEAKAMLVSTVLCRLPGIKVVAASGMAGCGSSNSIRTERRMRDLYVCGDGENGTERGIGMMAPRVQICAGHQANMVLRLLMGLGEA